MLFSVTLSKKIDNLGLLSLNNPIYIQLKINKESKNNNLQNLDQGYLIIDGDLIFYISF